MLIKTGIFLPEPRKTNVSSQEKNNKPPKKPHTANRLDLTDNFWKIEVFSSSFICLIIENETKTSNSEERGISETERLPVVSVWMPILGYLVYRVIAILFACVQGSEPSIKKHRSDQQSVPNRVQGM